MKRYHVKRNKHWGQYIGLMMPPTNMYTGGTEDGAGLHVLLDDAEAIALRDSLLALFPVEPEPVVPVADRRSGADEGGGPRGQDHHDPEQFAGPDPRD